MFLLNPLGVYVSFYGPETEGGVSLFYASSDFRFAENSGFVSFGHLRVSSYARRWNI
jgi:hypothetical protein